MVTSEEKRVVHVVASGDFATAYRTITSTGGEYYGAQRKSVEACIARCGRVNELSYVRFAGGIVSDERLPCGVRYISLAKKWDQADHRAAAREILKLAPTHVVLGFDSVQILEACVDAGISTLPVYANSFHYAPREGSALRDLVRRSRHRSRSRRLGQLLSKLDWIANHNLPASKQLVDLGVDPGRVIPYEVPATARPEQFEAKTGISEDAKLGLLFVGAIAESKGAFDAVRAIAKIRKEVRGVKLRIIGSGEDDRLKRLIGDLGVFEGIEVLGRVRHDDVLKYMRAADVVIVPSRWDFLEGLPLTIFESQAVRTPLVCSDHPMFTGRLRDGVDCLMFKAKDDAAMARQVLRLKEDKTLYRSLSEQSAETWKRIRCDALVDDVIDHWLSGRPEDVQWLQEHSLGSGRYDGRDLSR